MRGAEYGEIDQLAWITMTDQGPVISNIELASILPKDFAKPEATRFIYDTLRFLRVAVPPYYTNGGALPANYETEVLIQNRGESEVSFNFDFPEMNGLSLESKISEVTVSGGESKTIPLQIKSLNGQPIVLPTPIDIPYTISASLANEADVQFVESLVFTTSPVYPTDESAEWIVLDDPDSVGGNTDSWAGPEDGSLKFKVERKEDMLEIEIVAFDDVILPPTATEHASFGDGIELRVSPVDDPVRSIETTQFWQDQNKSYFAMYLVPDIPVRAYSYNYGVKIPKGSSASCVSEGDGSYRAKVSIPISVFDDYQEGTAEKIRLSVGLNDRDEAATLPAQIWWPEDWRTPEMVVGSGTFEL